MCGSVEAKEMAEQPWGGTRVRLEQGILLFVGVHFLN